VSVVSLGVTACSPPAEPEPEDTSAAEPSENNEDLGTVNSLMSTADLVLYLPAQLGPEQGKFDACNVDVNVTLGQSDTVSPAILAGEADIALQFGGRAVGDIMQGVPAKVVAAQTPNWVMPLVISNALYDSGIQSPEDLEQLGTDGTPVRFGITSIGAATHFSLLKLAEFYGWTEGVEFEFVPLGRIGEITAALEAGEIDAFVFNRDVVMRVVDEGLGHMFDRDVIAEAVGPTLKEVFMASDKIIEENPEAVVAYFECYFDYVEELKANPDEARRLAIEKFGASPEALDLTLAEDIADWSSDGSATREQLEGLAANTVFQNEAVDEAPVEEWWLYWEDLRP
jgi:ABC-type nitrate/sulfonate/bicarbonate transport system substrate-binding protein